MNQFTQILHSSHVKNKFSCGTNLLDNYIKHQASQDVKRKLSACFVLIDIDSKNIEGFYTLSNNSIPLEWVPEGFKKHLPASYSSIPTTLLGRLAVDKIHQGKGIGKLLLIDALKRSYEISKQIGSFAVVVDPIDQKAEMFYAQFGFIMLPTSRKMFLPMKTINPLFE